VICPIALIIERDREEAAKFQAMHQLFLLGNFPIGFGQSDELLILVAD
jgi:hypothetical protein